MALTDVNSQERLGRGVLNRNRYVYSRAAASGRTDESLPCLVGDIAADYLPTLNPFLPLNLINPNQDRTA